MVTKREFQRQVSLRSDALPGAAFLRPLRPPPVWLLQGLGSRGRDSGGSWQTLLPVDTATDSPHPPVGVSTSAFAPVGPSARDEASGAVSSEDPPAALSPFG